MRIALASCAEVPRGGDDDRLLVDALHDRGHETAWIPWDDAAADWASFELVVLRSTWDYSQRRDEFLAWTQAIGTRLVNAPEIVAVNTDKRYLAELRRARLPVIPTLFVEARRALPIIEGEVVVKPTVSAGSRDTARFASDEESLAAGLIGAIHRSGRVAMVQPYVPSVDARGETALMYFGGRFSHAVSKAPLLRPGARASSASHLPETIAAREPTARERAVADRVVAWLGERFDPAPAYARIDLVEGPGGGPLVLEVELTEPSLFLDHAPAGAAQRLADALLEQR